jgi:hypothetical protein
MKKRSILNATQTPELDNPSAGFVFELPKTPSTATVPNVTGMCEDFAEPEYCKDQKTGIVTRHSTPAESIALMKAAEGRADDLPNLLKGPCWIAELDGKIVGCLGTRLIFEVHPFPVPGAPLDDAETNERAEQLLLEMCHRWMRSFRNGLGISHVASIASTPERQHLLARLGWKLCSLGESMLFGRTF